MQESNKLLNDGLSVKATKVLTSEEFCDQTLKLIRDMMRSHGVGLTSQIFEMGDFNWMASKLAKKKLNFYFYEVVTPEKTWQIVKSDKQLHHFQKQVYKVERGHMSLHSIGLDRLSVVSFIHSKTESQQKEVLNNFETCINEFIKHGPRDRHTTWFLLEFLGISVSSFKNVGSSAEWIIQCYVHKRKAKSSMGLFRSCCGDFFLKWSRTWVLLNSDGMLYYNDPQCENPVVLDSLYFDTSLRIRFGQRHSHHKTAVLIHTSNKTFYFRVEEKETIIPLIFELAQTIINSPYVPINRFSSFAPVRQNNKVKLYVEGKDYFADLYTALTLARDTIFITGWWVTPELYLIRPKKEKTRLDNVLLDAAKRGVRILILIFKEPIVLFQDSKYVKNKLQGLHPNISVIRHPNKFLFLWSHHEKLVIIDESLAFVGGIDICYGRYDDHNHPIVEKPGQETMYPYLDFFNMMIKDYKNVSDFQRDALDRNKEFRKPHHDISSAIVGESVKDLAHHFIQYWNFATMDSDINDSESKLVTKGTINNRTAILSNHVSRINPRDKASSDGASFSNYISQRADNMKNFALDNKKKRLLIMAVMKSLQDQSGNDLFGKILKTQLDTNPGDDGLSGSEDEEEMNEEVQKIRYQYEKEQVDKILYKAIMGHEEDKMETRYHEKKGTTPAYKKTLKKSNLKRSAVLRRKSQKTADNEEVKKIVSPGNNCETQVLRSGADWSIGIGENAEMSIYLAYLELISMSKHYIYIENQFFISSLAGPTEGVKNIVAEAIVNRILRAHKENEELKKIGKKPQKFRVMIGIPLLPEFPADINEKDGGYVKITVGLQLLTIARGPMSMFGQLNASGINPDDYIQIFSLRQHGLLNGETPVTEQIYIHSKLIIVDDSVLLVGSANINDRSMLGTRDSEIAVSLPYECSLF